MWRQVRRSSIQVTAPTMPESGVGSFLTWILDDVHAVRDNDPAARNALEILLAYPGLHALWLHRVAHRLWDEGLTTSARLLSHFNRSLTGIEIHPGARLGRRVFIDHGMGVVIGETAVVGDECLIYKGVVLGGTSLERTKRHPTLGRGVVVGSNACILGNIQIGDGARIGSGSVVILNVPEGATAVGIPGRVVSTTSSPTPLAHDDLPDPVATVVSSLLQEIDVLRDRLEALEAQQIDSDAQHKEEHSPPSIAEVQQDAARERERQGQELAAVFFEGAEE